MNLLPRATTLAILAAALTAGRSAAQTDYRNLDEGRPVGTEDAYPVERYAFELVLPYAYENENESGDDQFHLFIPELSYGILPNAQVGVALPFAALRDPADTRWGFAGPRLLALYNFNTESPLLPAFALKADVGIPTGSLAGQKSRVTLKGIATRSWGMTRAHLNAAVSLGSDSGISPVEAEPDWALRIAVDHTLFRNSILLIGDIGMERAVAGAPTELTAALGARYQLTPTLVLDAGISRRLRDEVGPDIGLTIGLTHVFSFAGLFPKEPAPVTGQAAESSSGQPDQRDEQFYYPGAFNWQFSSRYPEAGRLFNAFDYGHAVLYERLLTEESRSGPALEREYRFLTEDLLVNPPRFAIPEEAIMPSYAKVAWQANAMFDWAHVLHRQIYDVYADDRLSMPARDSLIEQLTDYYLSRGDYAFTPIPKSMELMDEQPFSQSFRKEEPKFNGLIWAYHWLQVGLYEPLIAAGGGSSASSGVAATVEKFWRMVQNERFPRVMPMTSTVAPEFSRRHPRAAVIFDNLHMMHDIISDILASDKVTADEKRDEIYRQLAEFRNPVTNTISMDEWRAMGHHMGGVDAMGGSPMEPSGPLP